MHCRECHNFVNRGKKEEFVCPHCGSTQKPYWFSNLEIFGFITILIVVPLLCFIAWQLALFKDRVADNINQNMNSKIQQVLNKEPLDNLGHLNNEQKEKMKKTMGLVSQVLQLLGESQ